eukprot:g4412.t1
MKEHDASAKANSMEETDSGAPEIADQVDPDPFAMMTSAGQVLQKVIERLEAKVKKVDGKQEPTTVQEKEKLKLARAQLKLVTELEQMARSYRFLTEQAERERKTARTKPALMELVFKFAFNLASLYFMGKPCALRTLPIVNKVVRSPVAAVEGGLEFLKTFTDAVGTLIAPAMSFLSVLKPILAPVSRAVMAFAPWRVRSLLMGWLYPNMEKLLLPSWFPTDLAKVTVKRFLGSCMGFWILGNEQVYASGNADAWWKSFESKGKSGWVWNTVFGGGGAIALIFCHHDFFDCANANEKNVETIEACKAWKAAKEMALGGEEKKPPLLWLCGNGGSGLSAPAQGIAEKHSTVAEGGKTEMDKTGLFGMDPLILKQIRVWELVSDAETAREAAEKALEEAGTGAEGGALAPAAKDAGEDAEQIYSPALGVAMLVPTNFLMEGGEAGISTVDAATGSGDQRRPEQLTAQNVARLTAMAPSKGPRSVSPSNDPPQQLHRRSHPPRARTVFAPAPGAAAATDVEDRTPGLPTKPGTGDAAAFDAMTGNVLQKGESPLNNPTAQSTDGSQSSESNEKSLQGVRVDQAERLVDQIQDSLDEIFNPKVESLGSGAGGTGAGGAGDQDTSMDEPAQPSLGAEEVKEIQEKLAIMQKAAFEDLPQAERFVENAIHTIDRKVNNMKKLLAS